MTLSSIAELTASYLELAMKPAGLALTIRKAARHAQRYVASCLPAMGDCPAAPSKLYR
jgi:hypothetical protein